MKRFVCLFIIFSLAGCASKPTPRIAIESMPISSPSLARIYFTAGKYGLVRMWNNSQVGPVFINGLNVGSTAKNEHFSVDIEPGEYEIYCDSHTPNKKRYSEKKTYVLSSGDKRYFACDMAKKGVGVHFGLIGILASEYLWKSMVNERPLDNPKSRYVEHVLYKNVVDGELLE